MRILLTAYEPFRNIKENITERVADEIQKNWGDSKNAPFGTELTAEGLTALKLLVEWTGAEIALTRALEELRPDVVVSMGHAENYPAITIETRYFNIAEGEDNLGFLRAGGIISKDGVISYDTNIDASELAKHLVRNNIHAVLHAGKEGMSYLCNFAGYIVMRHIKSRGQEKPLFIFLHLPPDTIPFPVLVRGVREVINFLASKARQ